MASFRTLVPGFSQRGLLLALVLTGLQPAVACLPRTKQSHVAAASDSDGMQMNAEILRRIFPKSSSNPDTVVPAWPFMQEAQPAKYDQAQVEAKMQQLLTNDHTWNFIRKLAAQHNVKVSLAGESAGRLVHRATVILRREGGEERISPYAVGATFDDTFPLYKSLMHLVVDGDKTATATFNQKLHDAMDLFVKLDTKHRSDFDPLKMGGEAIGQMLLPIDGDVHIPKEVFTAFSTGELNGDLGASPDKMRVLHTLNALSLFELEPNLVLKAHLDAAAHDFSALDHLEGDDLAKMNLLYAQAFLESADREKFHEVLRSIHANFNISNFAVHGFFPGFLESLPNKKPLSVTSEGTTSAIWRATGGRFSQYRFKDDIKYQLVNHTSHNYDDYRSKTLSPYGKINAYMSGYTSDERALYGRGLYLMNNWTQYFTHRYAIYAVENPNLKMKTVGTLNYALSTDAAEAYIVMPDYKADPGRYLQDRDANRQVDMKLQAHERRHILELNFNPEFAELRKSFLAKAAATSPKDMFSYTRYIAETAITKLDGDISLEVAPAPVAELDFISRDKIGLPEDEAQMDEKVTDNSDQAASRDGQDDVRSSDDAARDKGQADSKVDTKAKAAGK